MKLRDFCFVVVAVSFVGLLGLEAAGPTEEREWTSTAGTKLTATATGVENGSVAFKAANGRAISVPLDKLVEADRAFLTEHFELNKPSSSESTQATDLAHPLGETVQNIEATSDSSYHVYLPESLKAGRKAPLLFFTSAGGGKPANIELMKVGSELCGWIVAACVESRNGNPNGLAGNHEHTKDCLEHIFRTLPVDEERVYFTGGSGGGATSMYNASLLDHAGVICCIGYIPEGIPSGGFYIFINGATDYNRTPSAHWRNKLGEDAMQLYHSGGHRLPPEWIMTDAMVRLNGMWLTKEKEDHPDERVDFEASMIEWIGKLKAREPWRAYAWSHFLQNDYEVDSANKSIVDDLVRELEADEKNVKYREGLIALDKFALDEFSSFGQGSQAEHVTSSISRAAANLGEEYAGVPHIAEIATNLGKPSVAIGGGRKK
ncbi:MAG: hypothetical protein AAGA58_00445 [Verrucomicrobiota bacterium]